MVLDCAISSLAFEKREVANSLTDNGMRFTWPESRHLGQMPLKPVMGGPTEVLNDEGIGHTAGTPVAGNVTLYWGVIWGVIDRANQRQEIAGEF